MLFAALEAASGSTQAGAAPLWKFVFEDLESAAGGVGLGGATSVRPRPFWIVRPRQSTDDYSRPMWSPDGRDVAFSEGDSDDLHVVRADGRGLKRIATGEIYSYRWSPDGTKIAFADCIVQRCEHGHIDIVERDGSGRHVVLRPNDLGRDPWISIEDWSVEGDRLLYRVINHGRQRLYSIGAEGGSARLLADSRRQGGLRHASWSSDGRLVAYTRSCDYDRWGVYCDLAVMNADGTSKRVVHRQRRDGPVDGSAPVWIRGTNRFVFSAWGPDDVVRALDAVTGRSTVVSPDGWFDVGTARDGMTVGGVRPGQPPSVVLRRLDGTFVARANMRVDRWDHDTDLWIG
jgi:Tol biopolymer transport system component